MAIAFSLPSDECTLEHYRRIQQLLLDLINLLRTLISSETSVIPSPSPNATVPASGSQFGFPTPPSSVPNSPSPFSPNATSSTSAFVLPDVITSSASIEELRNFLISRNCPSLGATAPSAAPIAPLAPSMQRPTIQEANDSQRIPVMAAEPLQNRGTASANAKLRKRKRARISRRKKCCMEWARENEPTPMDVSPSSPASTQSNQTMPAAGHAYGCDRYRKTKATTFHKCSCNDVCGAKTGQAESQYRNQHHQPDSEFYMDHAYYRRIAAAAAAATNATTSDCKSQNSWMFVGEELRRMTDGFRSSNKKDEKLCEESENKGLNGLISHCGRTVFAAALLVLGWKLLK